MGCAGWAGVKFLGDRDGNQSQLSCLLATCAGEKLSVLRGLIAAMLEFMDFVQQAFYNASRWSYENNYTNLTATSRGELHDMTYAPSRLY